MARVLGEARSRARLRESTSTWYNSSQWKLLLQSFKNRPSCGLVWHSRADASPWRLPCGQGIFCVNCRNRSSGCRRPERLCWRRRSSSRQSSRRSRRTCQRTNTNRHRWKRLTRRHGATERGENVRPRINTNLHESESVIIRANPWARIRLSSVPPCLRVRKLSRPIDDKSYPCQTQVMRRISDLIAHSVVYRFVRMDEPELRCEVRLALVDWWRSQLSRLKPTRRNPKAVLDWKSPAEAQRCGEWRSCYMASFLSYRSLVRKRSASGPVPA